MSMLQRECGSCSMCCTAMAVPELGKPNGVRCDHLSPAGKCEIHETKPPTCAAFQCLFLRGLTPIGTRPDQVSAVLHVEDGQLGEEAQALVIYATNDRWRRYKYIARLIRRFVKRDSGAFIINGDSRQLITNPGSKLARIVELDNQRKKDEEA